MSIFTFNMPDVGEGVAEAEIVDWHVKAGDRVEEDQHLVDVLTDKATIDIESPVSGTVLEIAGDAGDTVAVGAMLLVIEADADADADEVDGAGDSTGVAVDAKADGAMPIDSKEPVLSEPARSDLGESDAGQSDQAGRGQAEQAGQLEQADRPEQLDQSTRMDQPDQSQATASATTKVLASPAVRQRARDLGIDLEEIKPAADGRVRHKDLDQFIAYSNSGGFAAAAAARADETVKVIGMRRRIAQNMAASKRHIPHFSYVEECDVTELEQMRGDLNANRGHRPKLTMLPLLITAICKCVPEFPMINARYDDESGIVTRHGAVHMGIATQTDKGLMVPVLRDAQSRNLWQLANEIARLAQDARDGSAPAEELSGSTLTITSLGPLGGLATTPVINRPEVAIIGPNRIIERPMYVSDNHHGGERIEKRKLMNISISCDHRVVDGYDAASFVQAIKRMIETPVLLLSDI